MHIHTYIPYSDLWFCLKLGYPMASSFFDDLNFISPIKL